MTDITGIVQEIRTKPTSSGKPAYDLVVGGQAYGAGLYAPKCKVGDYVKFELDESRGYKNVARNSLKVSSGKPPAEAVAAAEATAPKVSTTGGTVDMKQEVISRQSALNSAIAFMQLASSNDALGLPKTDTKGKKLEALETLLHKFVAEFYEENTGVAYKSIAPNAKVDEEEAGEGEEDVAAADDQWN